jgi:N utilization substance protein B
MSSRSKGRKRALDILYEAELRGRAATAFLEERLDENTPAIADFARLLVNGVMAYKF